jgi:hypothetical protein
MTADDVTMCGGGARVQDTPSIKGKQGTGNSAWQVQVHDDVGRSTTDTDSRECGWRGRRHQRPKTRRVMSNGIWRAAPSTLSCGWRSGRQDYASETYRSDNHTSVRPSGAEGGPSDGTETCYAG